MAANNACAILGQKFWNGGWAPAEGYRTNAAYAGTNVSRWYPCILKFTVPEFTGVSTQVEFTLYVGNGAGESPTLRWALCGSDENMELYRDTNSEVADSHQLATGTVTMENVETNHYQTITVKTSRLRSGGTYYLFLWGYAPPEDAQWITVYTSDNHTAVLSSMDGAVRLKTSGGVKLCAVYNGSGKRMIPYVKTKTGPRPAG